MDPEAGLAKTKGKTDWGSVDTERFAHAHAEAIVAGTRAHDGSQSAPPHRSPGARYSIWAMLYKVQNIQK